MTSSFSDKGQAVVLDRSAEISRSEICYFLKRQSTFSQFLLYFVFINKTLRVNNLKLRIAMRKFQCLLFALKRSYILLLYNLYDCTFKHLQPALSSYIESHSIDFLSKSSKLFLYEGNIGFERDVFLFPWIKSM